MKRFITHACLLLITCSGVLTTQAQSQVENDAIQKLVKALITNIRQSKDAAAFSNVNLDAVSRYLLQDWYQGSTETQRKEFARLFQAQFIKIACPKIRENFKNLNSVVYDPPKITGNEATVDSRIELSHPMRNQEMKLRYSLVKEKGTWKVYDVAVLGSSVLQSIREDNVQPKLKEGGITALLGYMQKL